MRKYIYLLLFFLAMPCSVKSDGQTSNDQLYRLIQLGFDKGVIPDKKTAIKLGLEQAAHQGIYHTVHQYLKRNKCESVLGFSAEEISNIAAGTLLPITLDFRPQITTEQDSITTEPGSKVVGETQPDIDNQEGEEPQPDINLGKYGLHFVKVAITEKAVSVVHWFLSPFSSLCPESIRKNKLIQHGVGITERMFIMGLLNQFQTQYCKNISPLDNINPHINEACKSIFKKLSDIIPHDNGSSE